MHADNGDSSDDSSTFWPGYVDAVTNLVLNLLFLLTILCVALFMFALQLGRSTIGPKVEAAKKTADKNVSAELMQKQVDENTALKQQLLRLNKLLLATVPAAKPDIGVEKVNYDADITVLFKDDAVSLNEVEYERLKEALKPVVARGKARLYVDVPKGFSEAKRMAFYRAMEVRNLMLIMKMPSKSVEVIIHEGKADANASLVKVYSQSGK